MCRCTPRYRPGSRIDQHPRVPLRRTLQNAVPSIFPRQSPLDALETGLRVGLERSKKRLAATDAPQCAAVSPFAILMTSIWGGLMALERRAFLQAMVSRPLVAAPVTALLLGDALAGLYVGLVFELLHLGGASLGGAHADHDTLPAVAGAAMAAGMGAASGSDSTPAMWALSILVCAPFGRAGRMLENRLDARARKYFGRAVTAADAGNIRKAARQNLRAMWPQFVFYGLICGLAALVGPWLGTLEDKVPLPLVRGLAWSYPAMGVAAAAAAVHGSHAPRRLPIAMVAGLAVSAWLLSRAGV
jgi:mannose/fructose/N-acetylgalactosamine-specific phosphotransferase system component IIC